MKLKIKLLKALIIVSGAICLYAFISVRIPVLFNLVLKEKVYPDYWDKTKYGELYYFNHINHFKEEGLPPAKTKFQYKSSHSSLNECDIITFGDSYFDFSRVKQFSERLHDEYNFKVHLRKADDILSYLEKNDYDTTVHRVLIYERTERWIPLVFRDSTLLYKEIQAEATNSGPGSFIKEGKDLIFLKGSEKLYDAMLRRSYLTHKIYSSIATIKFDLFGYISSYTPKYYLQDTVPWLFYYDQLNDEPTSFYYKHSNKEMDCICKNIVHLSNTLRDKYNITFVFLPLPAKYTLYHSMLNNDEYNNFIQKLYSCLEQEEIKYVNVFMDYSNSKKPVFYGTDEHWNETGISIAFDKTIEVLKKDSVTSQILFNSSKKE